VQTIVLDWTGTEQIFIGEETFDVETVKGFGLDNGLPFYALQQKHSNINQEIEILSLDYVKIPKEQVQIYDKLGLNIQGEALIDSKVVTDAGQPFLSLYILPLRKKDGVIERLTQVTYRLKNRDVYQTKDYASTSVLGSTSGKWYRIALEKDGIYT
jgi:hypothetical protein